VKAYILAEADFEKLLANIDRDPRYGMLGGSSSTLTKEEQEAFTLAHKHFNYWIRSWIDEVKK
jgi:hypothetical protein